MRQFLLFFLSFVFLSTSLFAEPPIFKAGPSFSVLDYKQTGVATTTQLWLGARGEGEYALSSDWGLNGKAGLGLLPISKSGTDFNLRHLEMSLGMMYQGWRIEEEGFFPSAGYHYETFINGDNFGFRNIHGPWAALDFRFQLASKKLLDVELGASILATDSGLSTTNQELSFKLGYHLKEFHEKISLLSIEAQAKRVSLKFATGEVGAYFCSLNILASF
jgi:hypothetical protein